MADIVTKKFTSWKDLSEFINVSFTHFTGFVFRGHANATWKLESTLARSINEIYPKRKEDVQELIDTHLNSFRMNIRGKSKVNFKNVDDNSLWAMGQHFGLYTPLLDFTRSPYVALFFALQGDSESGERCVWAISENYLDEINVSQKDPKMKLEIIVPFTNDNPRLVNQQGLFVKIPLNCTLEKLMVDYEFKPKGVIFFKLVFTDNFTQEALAILQNMNINQLTLFPDLIGAAFQSNFQFEMAPYKAEIRKKIWEEHDKKKTKK